MSDLVLGLSAYYHDSAAALIADGLPVAAAQEERFSRRRHDPAFPARAVEYCLRESGVTLDDVSAVAYYEDPALKFRRVLASYLGAAPLGFGSFARGVPEWLSWKRRATEVVTAELAALGRGEVPSVEVRRHHASHAASAFLPSPYESAAVLCVDGVGEWATTTLWHGRGSDLRQLGELRFPHSLGLLYSAFTYFCGFKVDSGEYKLMGLAPYGKPRYAGLIRERLIDIKPDGSFRLDMRHFAFLKGEVMTGRAFEKLFGGSRRNPEGPLTEREFDLAASVQEVTEEVMIRLARTARERTGESRLCLAGGVALNCVANGRVIEEGIFDEVWIQPAAGDAGERSVPHWQSPPTGGRPGPTSAAAGMPCPAPCSVPTTGTRRSPSTSTTGPSPTPGSTRRRSRTGWPRSWPRGRWPAGSRAGPSSVRGHWAPGRSWATRATPGCSPP